MAEEQEKTNKPKSTLIKHRRPEPAPEKSVEAIEKKKVVVVKKKVVVKKATHKVVAKKDITKTVDKKQESANAPIKDNKPVVKTEASKGQPSTVGFTCPQCKSQLNVNVPPNAAGEIKVKCPKCQTITPAKIEGGSTQGVPEGSPEEKSRGRLGYKSS